MFCDLLAFIQSKYNTRRREYLVSVMRHTHTHTHHQQHILLKILRIKNTLDWKTTSIKTYNIAKNFVVHNQIYFCILAIYNTAIICCVDNNNKKKVRSQVNMVYLHL